MAQVEPGLSFGGTNITWSRTGARPEFVRVYFEGSTNGSDWINLGAGQRITNGWQLTGVNFPTNGNIRARGSVSGGQFNGSSWYVDNIVGPLMIIGQPVSKTNNAGTAALFSVVLGGTTPVAYQWLKGGLSLSEGGNISGSQNATLTLGNVLGGDAGAYSLVASNSFGSVTSQVVALSVRDPFINAQPTNQFAVPGQSVSLSLGIAGSAPLNYRWRKNAVTVSSTTNSIMTLTSVQVTDGGGYDVVVSNSFGVVTSAVAMLTINAAPPDSFNPGVGYGVYVLALQPDHKILAGGNSSLIRFNADGTQDSGFRPATNGTFYSLAVQTDGKILVGGNFSTLGGQARNNIGRLNADGSLDTSFNASANGSVYTLAVQTDGNILVGGAFTALDSSTRYGVGRIYSNGTLDAGFNPGVSYGFSGNTIFGGVVYSLAVQPNGNILVGGSFAYLGGQAIGYSRSNIGRVDSYGSIDYSFNPGANSEVYSLMAQADGKIVVGGGYTTLAGQTRSYIGRLNPDGSLDSGFNPGANSWILSLALQTDGKILTAGYFSSLGGQPRSSLGRLNADGALDVSFNPAPNGTLYSLAIQEDGKLLVGGTFNTLGGMSRINLGRLNATDSAVQTFAYDGSTATWLRGGTSPEVWRASFDTSANGTNWSNLGSATRIAGGWRKAGVIIPATSFLRARGFAVGGQYNGSSGIVEITDKFAGTNPPVLVTQPVGLTNKAGTSASFNITATGTPPFGYQWLKDGLSLSNNGNISGAQSLSMSLGQISGWDAGGYSVIITNAYGSVTSVVAYLSVIDPFIITQPVSRTNNAGTVASFTVLGGGASLSYQWLKGGSILSDSGYISGTHAAMLTISNVLGADAGSYWVVLSDAFGSITSLVATLTVVDPAITSQPMSLLANAGDTVVFNVTVAGTMPLDSQWRKNSTNVVATATASLTLMNVQITDAGSYSVLLSNVYGSVTSAIATLTVNLAVPDLFNSGTNIYPGSVRVLALAVQADGSVVVGGDFRTLGVACTNICRFNSNWTLDTNYIAAANGIVNCLAIMDDGKILVGGSFTRLNGQAHTNIGRLNVNGTTDTSFVTGANGNVNCLALSAEGKILVGGNFTSLGAQSRNYIGRLNENGTLDSSFNPGAGSGINSIVLQNDGKIVTGGNFQSLAGQSRNYIGRLNADGTLDNTFNLGTDSTVDTLAVQGDGKIVVGGYYYKLGGQSRNSLGRLNGDGTLDPTFNPGTGGAVATLGVEVGGRIVAGGSFGGYVGGNLYYLYNRLLRLNTDGTLDITFALGISSYVNGLCLQGDGKIVVGGDFGSLGGQLRTKIARLNSTEPTTQTLSYDGSSVMWLRGGTSTEVWRTSFDASTNGTDWTSLGAGVRVPGGWQIVGVSLPAGSSIRARGFATGGQYNGSCWFVETKMIVVPPTAPVIILNDGNFGFRTNYFGFTIQAIAGQTVVIEVSTNLINWVPLATNLFGADWFGFRDPNSGNLMQRFYRVRLR